jgi:cleavage and polyadenylation specificity factor subunit 2
MDDSDMGGDVNDSSTSETEPNLPAQSGDEPMDAEAEAKPPTKEPKRKFVATIHEVSEAFDSVNTLRYSQPTHLQGALSFPVTILFSAYR